MPHPESLLPAPVMRRGPMLDASADRGFRPSPFHGRHLVVTVPRYILLVLACLVPLTGSAEEDDDGVAVAPPLFANNILPGRAQPAAPAPTIAYRVEWDEYRTVLVVAPGKGSARPGWVATFDLEGKFVVGYPATAFRDRQGNVHFDARKVPVRYLGPGRWIPDSFAVTVDEKQMFTLDDQNSGHTGKVLGRIDAATDAAEHARLLALVQALYGSI